MIILKKSRPQSQAGMGMQAHAQAWSRHNHTIKLHLFTCLGSGRGAGHHSDHQRTGGSAPGGLELACPAAVTAGGGKV